MSNNDTFTGAVGVPIYFETSWSILSTIGLYNVLIGFMVIGITELSPVTAVPILVSAANAIADGLCYYAFYAINPPIPTTVAAVFADVFWLIQEAGLSLYSYQILIKILKGSSKRTFVTSYWILICVVAVFRFLITVARVRDILDSSTSRVDFIAHMHCGYFVSIALVESLSSYFLLRKFFTAQSESSKINSKVGLFSYLTRSTEIRLAVLTLIGITRAVAYSFQRTTQSATGTSGQLDRFLTAAECMFPIIMFIDILAAKSFAHQDHRHGSFGRHGRNRKSFPPMEAGPHSFYGMNNIQTHVNATGALSGSQEKIVVVEREKRGSAEEGSSSDGDLGTGGGINKTVEFMFYEGESPV